MIFEIYYPKSKLIRLSVVIATHYQNGVKWRQRYIAFMTSWRFISRCVLPKAIMALYITLRFTKIRHRALYFTAFYQIEMRSLWGQYTKKVILMLPIHEADISCHCIINEIWYMCCDIWYILSQNLIRVYTICHSQQSDQSLHCLTFSAVWPVSTLFAILSSLIRVYTVCHAQQSDQGLHGLPFSVWWRSTSFSILSSLAWVNTICHSQQSDQSHNYLPFSAVWSGCTLFAILSKPYYLGLYCLPSSAVWPGSTLFVIVSLIRVNTICHSQQSEQGL